MRFNSVFLSNIHHAYAQLDGTYKYPDSREGDMIRRAKKEIEDLLEEIEELKQYRGVGPDLDFPA